MKRGHLKTSRNFWSALMKLDELSKEYIKFKVIIAGLIIMLVSFLLLMLDFESKPLGRLIGAFVAGVLLLIVGCMLPGAKRE
jgi:hypothetical protein